MVERFNQTLLKCWVPRKSTRNKREGCMFPTHLVHAYIATSHDSTGFSPFFFMFWTPSRMILTKQGRRRQYGRPGHGQTTFLGKYVFCRTTFMAEVGSLFQFPLDFFNMMTKAWLLIDNWSVHSSIFRLPQNVKGGRYKNKIKKLRPVLTMVIIIKGL